MATWLPVSASILAVSGLAVSFGFTGDCASCQAPASTPAAVTAPVEPVQAIERDNADKQEVYVLKFHADWCGHCKKMTPVYNDMVERFESKPVGFAILDVTDKSDHAKAEAKMKELGLENIWKQNKGRNGFILLVDADTKKLIKKLNSSTSKEQAAKALEDALSS